MYQYLPQYELCDNLLAKIYRESDHRSVNIGGSTWQEMATLDELRVAARTLKEDGYINTSDTEILNVRLKTKGIAFIAAGGYKKHFEDLRERHKIEMDTLENNMRNATFQRKYGNVITVANVVVAAASVVTSVFVASYIAKDEKPVINNITVQIDSTFVKKYYFQQHDTADHNKPQK